MALHYPFAHRLHGANLAWSETTGPTTPGALSSTTNWTASSSQVLHGSTYSTFGEWVADLSTTPTLTTGGIGLQYTDSNAALPPHTAPGTLSQVGATLATSPVIDIRGTLSRLISHPDVADYERVDFRTYYFRYVPNWRFTFHHRYFYQPNPMFPDFYGSGNVTEIKISAYWNFKTGSSTVLDSSKAVEINSLPSVWRSELDGTMLNADMTTASFQYLIDTFTITPVFNDANFATVIADATNIYNNIKTWVAAQSLYHTYNCAAFPYAGVLPLPYDGVFVNIYY